MPTKRTASNLPPGIKVVTKHNPDGTLSRYLYARLPGKKLAPLLHPRTGKRIEIDEARPIIEGALRQALRQPKPKIAPAGVKLLISDYRASPEYKGLARNTLQRYGRTLDRIEDEFAWMTMDDLGKRKVRDDFYRWRDGMADTPAAADASIDVLCGLIQWAYQRGRVEVNHARDIGPLRSPLTHRRDRVWTPEIEERLLAVARPEVRGMYLLARYTALRQADNCNVEWGVNFDGEWIEMMPQKTIKKKIKVYIPVFALPPLAEHVATLAKDGYLLRSSSGKKVNPPNFRARLGEDMEKAGLGDIDLHFHDLRGTAVNDMLSAGATNAEAASITGHVIAEGAQAGFGAYAERSRKLALGAYKKWAAMLAGTPKVVAFGNQGKLTR
jgi:hypothetical protein